MLEKLMVYALTGSQGGLYCYAMRYVWKLLAVALVGLGIGAGAFYLHKSGTPRRSHPNLLLISLDTLRADRLGAYGYPRATSPFLDSLAKRSVLFEHAVTAAPWTLPSHVTLLTGMYPSAHGVSYGKGERIGDDTQLLAEILQKQGFRTFGYVAGGYLGKRFGFPRGFESYYVNSTERDQESQGFGRVLKMAREKLLSVKDDPNPYFMFLHTYTVHCPYSPPEPYFGMFQSAGAEKVDPHHCGRKYNGMPNFNANKALYLSDRYDGSVRFLDELLKDFFATIENDGALDDTIVVIVSDHGDSFYEHGRIGHGESLHKELLMVPLIIYGPQFAPRRVSEPVSLVDVFPTLLEALGFPVANQNQGRSLVSLLNGGREMPPQLMFAELDHDALLRSLINPLSDHFILDLQSDSPLFYDLVGDPNEQQNIAATVPDQIKSRRETLKKLMQGFHRRSTGTEDPAAQEHLEQLKTLGYL